MGDEQYMRLALRKAAEGVERQQAPFGAVIVKNGAVVSCEHNTVWGTTDITAHAEILVIRDACRRLNTVDLGGCTIYSTCEPCPMCFSACHWARISRIVYGARIEDAKRYGFHELNISTVQMNALGHGVAEIASDVLREESLVLFQRWDRSEGRHPY